LLLDSVERRQLERGRRLERPRKILPERWRHSVLERWKCSVPARRRHSVLSAL
jgi:hypothetical protein